MDPESHSILDEIHLRHDNEANIETEALDDMYSESLKLRVRALLVALLGVSMSACALASQPVELELQDEDVVQRLNNVSLARRITKPTIRLIIGYGKISALVTAGTSLLLLIAIMSKKCWWHRGIRWLAVPALLVTALEVVSDAGEATLAAFLQGTAEPLQLLLQIFSAIIMISIEILVWYFIAKFFEYNHTVTGDEDKHENKINILPVIEQVENPLTKPVKPAAFLLSATPVLSSSDGNSTKLQAKSKNNGLQGIGSIGGGSL